MTHAAGGSSGPSDLRRTSTAAPCRRAPSGPSPSSRSNGRPSCSGSTQRDDVVDRAALAAAGVDLVRRRSGGGAVLVEPARTVWIDVDVPVGDPLWSDDVGRSFGWLGRTWAAALGDLGLDARGARRWAVHHTVVAAHLLRRARARRGDGGGAKAVGLAQRRTRHGARFQTRRQPGVGSGTARRPARARCGGAGAGGRRPAGAVVPVPGPGGPGRRRLPRPASVTTRRNKPFSGAAPRARNGWGSRARTHVPSCYGRDPCGNALRRPWIGA